jgi:probable phosphoglycerate mutase
MVRSSDPRPSLLHGCADRSSEGYDPAMTDPLNRLKRRPLLAPLLLPLLAIIAAGAGVVWLGTWARTTVVIAVRHAETGPATSGDPELSPAGERRAARLGEFVADALPGRSVDHLYAADTRRAQQTAASVANQFKLPMNLLASSDWAGLASRIKRDHRGQTVVVVGYASTLPGVLSQLSTTKVTWADGDFDSVLVVVSPTPGQPRLLRLRYGSLEPDSAMPAAR